jgi:AraC family transcriptional regulator, regulatory protein of adaptative response / methylphosphotriester-DNA alkyltransferase methyltransferase
MPVPKARRCASLQLLPTLSHPKLPVGPYLVHMQRPGTVRHRTQLFTEAVRIVEAEYASDLELDDIARRVASSRRQLQRAYAEIGRTTFREHLTRVRMQRAAALLANGSLTVREVARRVGYRQPAQFAKTFRRHIGSVPSAYRTRVRERGEPMRRAA